MTKEQSRREIARSMNEMRNALPSSQDLLIGELGTLLWVRAHGTLWRVDTRLQAVTAWYLMQKREQPCCLDDLVNELDAAQGKA